MPRIDSHGAGNSSSKIRRRRTVASRKAADPHKVGDEPLRPWLAGLLLSLDKPFRFAGKLTSLGAVGVILAAVIQYSSWRDEKNLARHKEELDSAIATFSEISGALSAAMNLQQILFFTHDAVHDAKDAKDDQKINMLVMNGRDILNQYMKLRTTLRENIDVLTAKADLFIDRPTTPDAKRVEPGPEVPQVTSNRDVLRKNKYDCERDMPSSRTVMVGSIPIDWSLTRWHVATFYYCLEEIHSALLPVRVWASVEANKDGAKADEKKAGAALYSKNDDQGGIAPGSTKIDVHPKLSDGNADTIIPDFDRQTTRLNEFMAKSIRKIEEIRLKTKENGFFRHQLCPICEG
jgi:hypothetical protein